jgi:hypothetical protein
MDREITIAISGDPTRRGLGTYLQDMYRRYSYVSESRVVYKRNPAIAFNSIAREATTERIVCVAGDVLIGERELKRVILSHGDVVFLWNPIYPRRNTTLRYPEIWGRSSEAPFVSGLFRCDTKLLRENPLPEKPSFCEDILWEPIIKNLGYKFVAVHAPAVHIDCHSWYYYWKSWYWFINGRGSIKVVLLKPLWRLKDIVLANSYEVQQ